uniref:(northern house mosquito) hypothetical protein n=1 Tax=Culex pipiens TaxID=7175 RepID=A0A8D8FCA9_CULPI
MFPSDSRFQEKRWRYQARHQMRGITQPRPIPQVPAASHPHCWRPRSFWFICLLFGCHLTRLACTENGKKTLELSENNKRSPGRIRHCVDPSSHGSGLRALPRCHQTE